MIPGERRPEDVDLTTIFQGEAADILKLRLFILSTLAASVVGSACCEALSLTGRPVALYDAGI